MIKNALRRLRREESGLSMAEILVSAMLTLVIMIMVGNIVISATKITAASNQTSNSNGSAATIANETTSVIRVAATVAKSGQDIPMSAIVSGTRSSIVLYSLSFKDVANPAPVRVSITLDETTGVVTEARCAATPSGGFWSFGTCSSTSSRVLGSGMVAPSGTVDQFLTYYDALNQPILIGTGGFGATGSATDPALVASIKVQVQVKAPGAKTPPVLLKNTVVLGNLGLDNDDS